MWYYLDMDGQIMNKVKKYGESHCTIIENRQRNK